MAEVGTALVVNDNGLIPLNEVERALDELVERGAVEELAEGRARADAYAAYEKRRGAKERADYFGQVKVLAEAAIGYIDVKQYPFCSRDTGVLDLGVEIPGGGSTRAKWRALGQARLQGILAEALDAVVSNGRDITTDNVAYQVRRRGSGFVETAPLMERLRVVTSGDVSMSDISRRADVPLPIISDLKHGRKKRVSYPVAIKLAPALGLDTADLVPAAPSQKWRKRSRLPSPRKLRGGRWDRAYSAHRRTMEEVFELTGESGEPDLWGHLHAVEDFLKTRIR